jgi:DNA-binding protein
MAAELSSAAMALSDVTQASKPVSMLVLDMKANFTKKARTKVVFTCNNGKEISEAVDKAISTGEGQLVNIISKGIDSKGDMVSEFQFTWTFKAKS